MVNAWSLAYDVLNGTMDETYPIKKDKMTDDIKIETSKDEGVVNVPSDINLDNYEHSEYWYDYNRNDPDRPDPFVDAFDHMMETDSSDGYPSSFTTFSDNDDQVAHHFADRLTLNIEDPIQEIMSDSRNKYHENEILKDVEEYVSRTYNGHYTGTKHEYRNVQTIDFMA